MQMSISDWQFYFESKYGLENRKKVLKSFCDFMKNPSSQFFTVPGHVRIGGRVCNNASFADGMLIHTSEIVEFRKGALVVSDDEGMYTTVVASPFSNNISVLTISGHVYVLDYAERSLYMERMEEDSEKGSLSPVAEYYINPEIRVKKNTYL